MIAVNRMAAQGDVLFRRVDALSPYALEGTPERTPEGALIVAHSETGHHHAIGDPGVRYFERFGRDSMICYLTIDGPFADVVHHRPHDTHETLRLLHGTWEVRRQREWTPEGWRRVED